MKPIICNHEKWINIFQGITIEKVHFKIYKCVNCGNYKLETKIENIKYQNNILNSSQAKMNNVERLILQDKDKRIEELEQKVKELESEIRKTDNSILEHLKKGNKIILKGKGDIE